MIYTPPSEQRFVRIGRCGGSAKTGAEFPPIKLMYLAAVARKYADVLFIDADAEELSWDGFLQKIGNFKPDLLIIEPTPASLKNELDVIFTLKGKFPNAKAALTGPFASSLAEYILDAYGHVDYVFEGETETTIEYLIKSQNNIRSLYYRQDKQIIYNGRQDPIHDLDSLPFPIHESLPLKSYSSAFIKRAPYTIMETSRGCPYSCLYCNAFISNGTYVRYRSVDNVVEELDYINSLGIKSIYFNDEIFTINKRRTIALMDAIIKNNYKFSWICNSRADAVNEEILRLMKRAGCSCILYGVESGNQSLLDYYEKNINLKTILETFETTRKLGIETAAHFIFGAPGESIRTINDTIEFSIKLNPDYASFNILTAYPGTKLFELLKKQRLIGITDWSLSNQTCNANLNTNYLTAADLESALKEAYKQFYYRPVYIIKRLSLLRSFCDVRRLFRGFNALAALVGSK